MDRIKWPIRVINRKAGLYLRSFISVCGLFPNRELLYIWIGRNLAVPAKGLQFIWLKEVDVKRLASKVFRHKNLALLCSFVQKMRISSSSYLDSFWDACKNTAY